MNIKMHRKNFAVRENEIWNRILHFTTAKKTNVVVEPFQIGRCLCVGVIIISNVSLLNEEK